VATASYDNTARLWDAATGSERQVLRGHSNSMYSVAFSPDGKLVATASHDKTARLWDAATGLEVVSVYATAPGLSFLHGAYLGTGGGLLSLFPDVSQHHLYISSSGTWIKDGKEDLLFLHPDFREKVRLVLGRTIVFSDGSKLLLDTAA